MKYIEMFILEQCASAVKTESHFVN